MNGTMFDVNANDLLLFVAIVETGSLSGVSIRFNILKAMVSRRLSLLES
ncbi:MAG TPA: LysR family transcriptional regulator [Burkholderiales bacterium]|nr:LysR family transcriptional regulator [Burkholderiales bacterium]